MTPFKHRVLVASWICLVAIGWHRWRGVKQEDDVAVFQMPRIRSTRADWLRMLDTLRVLRRGLVSRDVFRSSTDSSVSGTLPADAAPQSRPRANARPTLELKAIAGPPWRAVVGGLPGQPNAVVVREGTVFDRLTIASVGRDSVVIRGPDTTWVLSLRHP